MSIKYMDKEVKTTTTTTDKPFNAVVTLTRMIEYKGQRDASFTYHYLRSNAVNHYMWLSVKTDSDGDFCEFEHKGEKIRIEL